MREIRNLNAYVILTNKIKFSNAVKSFFISMSPVNFKAIKIFTFGWDESDEETIIENIKNIKKVNKKINKVFIFSDFICPILKSEFLDNEKDNIIYSRSSLIEGGFLTFSLMNGGAPIESIMLSINENKTIMK